MSRQSAESSRARILRAYRSCRRDGLLPTEAMFAVEDAVNITLGMYGEQLGDLLIPAMEWDKFYARRYGRRIAQLAMRSSYWALGEIGESE